MDQSVLPHISQYGSDLNSDMKSLNHKNIIHHLKFNDLPSRQPSKSLKVTSAKFPLGGLQKCCHSIGLQSNLSSALIIVLPFELLPNRDGALKTGHVSPESLNPGFHLGIFPCLLFSDCQPVCV